MRATTNERKKEKESRKEEEKGREEARGSEQAWKRKRKKQKNRASVHAAEISPGSRPSLRGRSWLAVWEKQTPKLSTDMGKENKNTEITVGRLGF